MPVEFKACRQFDPEHLDLQHAEPIGSGAISQVVRSTLLCPPHVPVAVKIASKLQLVHQNKVKAAMNEKRALLELSPHPFITRLYGTSQSEDELYYVMEYLSNGDLLQHIRRCTASHSKEAVKQSATLSSPADNPALPKPSVRCLEFHDIQLITAQLVVGLSHVFEKGFVLRDLKPENVAFDSHYRACLLDFDTIDMDAKDVLPVSNNDEALDRRSKTNNSSSSAASPRRRLNISEIQAKRKITASFCGTAQYVSPEMLGQCRWSYSSDLWALGTIVYEMLYGTHMFPGENTYEVMKRIVMGVHGENVPFPFVDLGPEPDAFARTKDFILQLCRTDPTKRLGVDGVTLRFSPATLRKHPFFGDFDWSCVDAHLTLFHAAPGIDTSASLGPHYRTLPMLDPEYAKYVYAATADANPFERWALDASGEQPSSALCDEDFTEVVKPSPSTGDTPQSRPLTPRNAREVQGHADDSVVNGNGGEDVNCNDSDDSDGVIDDVGMSFVGHAAPDFML